MAVPCNATQVADFVLLWGMSGTFPEYCSYAEDARDLKSIDLIISTVGVFVEGFWLGFEDIYRKYKMDFPMSEEKFIEFLKPRCLLLTKDDKCFNFMLVCAFVSEVIHAFFEYNKCFHLVKVASKCLAAVLKNRFKRIFENDPGWKELMSFCIKIHDLIYPHVKKFKSDGNQSAGEVDVSAEKEDYGKESGYRFPVTVKLDASFPNLTQGLTELSVEKCATDDSDGSDTKVSGRKSSTPLKKDLTIEEKGEKLNVFCHLEFPISTGAPHTLQLKDEDSSSKEESVDKEITCDEKNARDDNKNVCATDMKDSSSPTLPQEIAKITINKNDEDTEKRGQMIGLKKHLDPSFRKDLDMQKVPQKLELCNFEPTFSTGESAALYMKGEVPSLNEESEDKETVTDESNVRDGNEKDYATNSLLHDLVHELAKMSTENKAINKNVEGAEKLGQMIGLKKHLDPSFRKDLAMQKVPEKLELCISEPTFPTGESVALHMKGEVPSLNEESEDKETITDESNARDGNEKEYATNLLLHDLLHELAKMSTEAIDKNVEVDERPGQMTGFRIQLTLSCGKDSIVGNMTKQLGDLCKLESASSVDTPPTLQLTENESSSKDESEVNEEPFSIFCMTADEICSRITDNPQHLSEIRNLIKNCEDIDPNLFSSDESDILISDDHDEDAKVSHGTLVSSGNSDLTNFELGIKTVVFATNLQSMIMDGSVKVIFRKDNSSDEESLSESSDEMSDEVAYESDDDTLASEDVRCPLCAGGMMEFFDACVNHFGTNWYWTHYLVTDLFSFECHENSE